MLGVNISRRNFFEGNAPLLLAFFANYAILLSTLLVISLFPRDTNLPLQLDNSPSNFPLGSITAVFSPDTNVFLTFASWKSWYLLTVLNFTIFLLLFMMLNRNLEIRERGIRFVFYSISFIALPVIGNIFYLIVTKQPTIGPSGAFYTSAGLLTGFGIVNVLIGVKRGLRNVMLPRANRFIFVLNGTIGLGLLSASFVSTSAFFSEIMPGYRVGYEIHIFCFYSAIIITLVYAYLRRSSLTFGKLRSKPEGTMPSSNTP